ncbi:unnamed protein product [Rotaria magnacalcarata]|uniref:Uncharacterized protein n=1 Tax=Rotaria magnacalcarata TaxID=392030 RepID=A0A816RU02_9BILA|nr:unnamed protein product [Rotaria magnacalcarata]
MQIKFGTTSSNGIRSGLFASILFGFAYFTLEFQNLLDNSHGSILRSPMFNATSFKIGFFCGIPYDDCRCSVQSERNEHFEYCLTDNFLLGSRILPLVSFVIQIWVIRDLFSFSGQYVSFLVYVLWITSVFLFGIIANGIYQNSCFHRYINGFFCCTDIIMFSLVSYDVAISKDINRSSCNNHNISNDSILEEIDDDPIFWRELL